MVPSSSLLFIVEVASMNHIFKVTIEYKVNGFENLDELNIY